MAAKLVVQLQSPHLGAFLESRGEILYLQPRRVRVLSD